MTFQPVDDDGAIVPGAQLFVGRYQARAVPVADTDAATPLTDQVSLVPGTYEFVARRPGRGHVRVGPVTVKPGQVRDLPVQMRPNLASARPGRRRRRRHQPGQARSTTTRPPTGPRWAARSPASRSPSTWPAAPSRSAGSRSARMLRPPITGDPDAGGQSRFSALRQFRVLACDGEGARSRAPNAADFRAVYTSAPDAFPSVAPRPRAPELIIRSFDIPRTKATHLRIEVVTNQCTGAPDYAGEQDDDPRAATDCATASVAGDNVRIAEFQAFAQ